MAEQKYKIQTWKKVLIAVVFILISGALIYTAFFSSDSSSNNSGTSSITGGFFFTGGAIQESDLSSPITINAKLDSLGNLDFNKEISSVNLDFSGNSNFDLGGQSFTVSGGDTLNLKNYDGEIVLESPNSLVLDGKVSEASINGVKISSNKKSSFKLSINNPKYNKLKLNETSIKEFSHKTSGTINVDNNMFNPSNEKVTIKSFVGDIGISPSEITLKGKAESLNIGGDEGISVST